MCLSFFFTSWVKRKHLLNFTRNSHILQGLFFVSASNLSRLGSLFSPLCQYSLFIIFSILLSSPRYCEHKFILLCHGSVPCITGIIKFVMKKSLFNCFNPYLVFLHGLSNTITQSPTSKLVFMFYQFQFW